MEQNMRIYDFYLYDALNSYGQPTLIKDENGDPEAQGQLKMAISIASQSIKDSIAYIGTSYIGLTHSDITDKYVIQYGEEKLKVLYVNPMGRYKIAYLGAM